MVQFTSLLLHKSPSVPGLHALPCVAGSFSAWVRLLELTQLLSQVVKSQCCDIHLYGTALCFSLPLSSVLQALLSKGT